MWSLGYCAFKNKDIWRKLSGFVQIIVLDFVHAIVLLYNSQRGV